MKRTFITLLAAAAISSAANAQVAFAPELGLNMSNITESGGGVTLSYSTKMGIRLGCTAEVGFSDNLYLHPGLFYVMDGASLSLLGATETISLNGLQIPIDVVYKFGKPGANRFFVGGGLSLTYYMSGSASGGGQSQDIKFGSDAGSMKAMNMGLNLQLGYQFGENFYIRALDNYGFSNLSNASGVTMNVSSYSLNVGYIFGGGGGKKGGHRK